MHWKKFKVILKIINILFYNPDVKVGVFFNLMIYIDLKETV